MLPLKLQSASRRLRSSGSALKTLDSDSLNSVLWLASRMRSVRDADCAAATLRRLV